MYVVIRIYNIKFFYTDLDKLQEQLSNWKERLQQTGEQLAKYVKSRDRLQRQQRRLCAAFTVILRHISK